MVLKFKCVIFVVLCSVSAFSQNTESQQFWNTLQSHCGKAYRGRLELPLEDKYFGDKDLVMHVKKCTPTEIKIPFFVGDDKSRTWILSYVNNRMSLKHDHRHEDGSENDINYYGGVTTNSGKPDIQIFSADEYTQNCIPEAATNVWWITIHDKTFTYNLRRLDTDRVFKVIMDITTPIALPDSPWGWYN